MNIKVLNWRENENHLEHTFTTISRDTTLPIDQVIGSVIEIPKRLMIAHKQLDYNSDYNTQYVMNDSLCVEITGVTVIQGEIERCLVYTTT